MLEGVRVAQGQLPPTGETAEVTAGDSSREETSSVSSMDPKVDAAEPKAALDGRVSPEQEHRVTRGQKSSSDQGPLSLAPFHTMLSVLVDGGGPLCVHPGKRRVSGGVCTYTYFAAGESKD